MLTPGRKAVNSPVRIAANFQDDTRTDIDPDTVAVKIYSPQGVITTYVYATDAEVIKASTGDYYIDYTPNESGQWFYRWETTGDNEAIAVEGYFRVQSSPFYEGVSDAYRR
jgi:hypothetical protein